MKTLVFAFLLLTHTLSYADQLPYANDTFGCFSEKDANKYIQDFSVDVGSFGGLELCDNSKDTKKLLNDIYLIDKSSFKADDQHKLIQGYVPSGTYYEWMKRQTFGVNRGHDIPWASAYNSGGYFTMQDGWASSSTLGRVGTIIHEARHTEGYRHYPCQTGPYAGTELAGCDTSYSQGGSHAIEMEYYARVVLDSTNLHPVYQSMARLMALGRTNFVFNQKPLQTREALAGFTGDKVVLLDGGQVFERATPRLDNSYKLKRTSFGASLVKGSHSIAVDLMTGGLGDAKLSDEYSYYKLFHVTRSGAPKTVVDTEEIDLGSNRYFVALNEEGKLITFNFPSGNWYPESAAFAGAKALVTRTPSGQTGLFVVNNEGAIAPFDPTNRRFGTILKEKWPSSVSAVAFGGDKLFKLLSSGVVVDASTEQAVRGLENYHFTDLVNVPVYDAFEIRP